MRGIWPKWALMHENFDQYNVLYLGDKCASFLCIDSACSYFACRKTGLIFGLNALECMKILLMWHYLREKLAPSI